MPPKVSVPATDLMVGSSFFIWLTTAAATAASNAVARMKAPADPRAEPWPPMKAGTGR